MSSDTVDEEAKEASLRKPLNATKINNRVEISKLTRREGKRVKQISQVFGQPLWCNDV